MSALLAVPNVSEGSDEARLTEIEAAFGRGSVLLDCHTDADHERAVFTLAGTGPGTGRLTEALVAGAEVALETIDMDAYDGSHPAIGSLDVCPIVWLDPAGREAGRTERAYFRNGGLPELWLRMESGELRPDFGPSLPHRSGGATLVTARPPLAAFNVELDSGDVEVSR